MARGAEAKRLIVAEFADRYLEEHCRVHNCAWVRKRDSVKVFKERFGHVELEALDANHVAKFVKWRQATGRANGTINRDLAHLKHMMHYALKLELIKVNRILVVDKLPE